MRRARRKHPSRRLKGLIPLGVVLVVFLTAIFIVKAGWLPNDVFAKDADWSPRTMYEMYLGEYREALANRATVAEEAKKAYEEALSRYRENLKKVGCSSAFTCSTSNGFIGRISLMNDDIWDPYICDNVDCGKIAAQREATEQAEKQKKKWAQLRWFDDFIRITKMQLPQSISMSKNDAYDVLSTLNPIVINTDADSLRNLQSALNTFKLPYKAEDLIPPSMDLLTRWKINADVTDLAQGLGAYTGWVSIWKNNKGRYSYQYYPGSGDQKNLVFKYDPFGGNRNSIKLFQKINWIINTASFSVAKDISAIE